MATATAGRFQVSYAEVGAGVPALLLHSGGLDGSQWRKLTARLSARRRVLVPDLLGYRESSPWPAGEPFDLREDVAAAAAVLAAAGGPAHLVGHSYGGLLALQLAAQRPAQVRSLALYEPVAFGALRAAGAPELAELDGLDADGRFFADATGGDAAWLERFIDYWNGPGGWARLPAPQRDHFLAVGRKLFLEVRSLSHDATPASAYAHVGAPTLLLSGGRSTNAARRVCELLEAAMPNARHERLEGATHMAPIVEADRVNALIEAHLDAAERAALG